MLQLLLRHCLPATYLLVRSPMAASAPPSSPVPVAVRHTHTQGTHARHMNTLHQEQNFQLS
jgi:hypothetical protein